MGASTFFTFIKRNACQVGTKKEVKGGVTYISPEYGPWPSARDAFQSAVDDARYEYGHGGYTGTIAEKSDFVTIDTVDSKEQARTLARALIDDEDPRIDDKWGPAGCIEVKGEDGGYLFFGWASD